MLIHPSVQPREAPDRDPGTPRCVKCAYALDGLPSPSVCPECGRDFDLADDRTFTRRAPFLRWKFWAPALIAAVLTGTILFAVLAFTMQNWGWAMWVATPTAAGVVLGYRLRTGVWMLGMFWLVCVMVLVGSIAGLGLAGVYCAMVLGLLLMFPVGFGALGGGLLRWHLKRTRFSQRDYLPIVIVAALPLIWGLLEGPVQPGDIETIVTTEVIEAPREACWQGLVFYEEVKHRPPLILRIGLAHPLFATGSSRRVGDVKTCVYNKGWITKRVTEAAPGKRLAFEVISQSIGYERDVQLTGGSFEFRDLGFERTEVRLSTSYRPLLSPRFAWRPFEGIAVHTLHRHVIEGIRRNAAEHAGSPSARAGP